MKMFKKIGCLSSFLSILLLLCMTQVSALETDWNHSYQLETAGKYAEALNVIENVSVSDAELAALRRGWLYYLQGSFSESIRHYRFAVERNSQSVEARLGLTLPLLAQKRWSEAEQNSKAALEISPNNYTALLRLAIALEGQRDWTALKKAGTVLVTRYPSDATAYVYLARANAWLYNRTEAVAAYRAVLSRSPGHLEAIAYLEKK